MTTTPEQSVVDRFAAAAKTPFGVLNPAKVVKKTMPLLHELRDVHQLAWTLIAPMFNAAMGQVGGRTLSSAALCRLYNIEHQKEILQALQDQAAAACRTLEEGASAGSGRGNVGHRSRTDALEPGTQAATTATTGEQAVAAPATPSNRVRDGPPPRLAAGTGMVPATKAAQVLKRLEEQRNFDEVRNKGKRNGRE